MASDGDSRFLFLGLPFGITLFADFSERKVIAAGNTGLSGKGATIVAPKYHK